MAEPIICIEAGLAESVTLASGSVIPAANCTVWVARSGARAPEWRGVPHLLTVDQVAERLSIGEWKVRELARTGALASVQVGTARRFHPDDINAYLDAHRTAARKDQTA